MAKKNKPEERRKYPRAAGILDLTIDSGHNIATHTQNLSGNGVYCLVEKHIPVMSQIKLTLIVPTHSADGHTTSTIECDGVVVRSTPSKNPEGEKCYQVAIFFPNLSESDSQKISTYVDQQLN